MNRDFLLGAAFFILMGVGGAFLVWLNWRKISVDERRDDQRARVQQFYGHSAGGWTRLEEARKAADPARRAGMARQAVDAFSAALAINAGEASVWAGRAEAGLLAGDRGAARRDLAEAKRLQPDGNWAELEKLCSAP